jgi:four helix bundle protein
MQAIASYKDLIVWQRSIQLTVAVYQLTAAFPTDERFGLTSQLRRAAVSIACNIAEGYGRGSKNEYRHFLGMARGSNAELQTQVVIASELGFGHPQQISDTQALSDEIARMLVSLMQKLSPPHA